jgi:hypothetical protein
MVLLSGSFGLYRKPLDGTGPTALPKLEFVRHAPIVKAAGRLRWPKT